MKVLAWQLGAMLLATAVAGLCCALVAGAVIGNAGVTAALAAAAIAIPAGVAVVAYFHQTNANVNSILVGTFLRLALTIGLGGALALSVESLQMPAYYLSTGIVYLANLALETRLILEKNRQQSERSNTSSDVLAPTN